MIELDLDRETLDCLGMRLVRPDDDDWYPPRPSLLDVLGPAPKEKRVRRATVKQVEKESGRTVTAVTVSPDGTRRYELGEKVDVHAVEIKTPEQLRSLI
jgi:hypothetical protein